MPRPQRKPRRLILTDARYTKSRRIEKRLGKGAPYRRHTRTRKEANHV